MSESPCRPWLPPEWGPQSGVQLTWPHDATDWAPILTEVEPVFVRIALEVSRRERIVIACRDEPLRAHVRALLDGAGVAPERIRLGIAPSNDSWARDHGPITVLCRNTPRLLDFRFNAWGGKYGASLDDAITRALSKTGVFGDTECESVPFVLEGGGIEVDGQGTLMATRRCLLAPTRNPGLDQAAIEARLAELLGLTRFLWLDHGALAGDDTDSHIDTLARFADARTITYCACDDSGDEHFRELDAMRMELESFRAADGSRYRLIPLPLPGARRDASGRRLPATYANFLIINGAVLAPTYDDPMDEVALARLQGAFPCREIIGIPCVPLIQQFGSLHCVTMQLPEGAVP